MLRTGLEEAARKGIREEKLAWAVGWAILRS
jgi:hypothetical protein